MITHWSLNQGFSPVIEFNKMSGFYAGLNNFGKLQMSGNRTIFVEKLAKNS